MVNMSEFNIPYLPQMRIIYTNYRGETSVRNLRVYNLFWGTNEWHKEPQWIVEALDVDKQVSRSFALKDMRPTGENNV